MPILSRRSAAVVLNILIVVFTVAWLISFALDLSGARLDPAVHNDLLHILGALGVSAVICRVAATLLPLVAQGQATLTAALATLAEFSVRLAELEARTASGHADGYADGYADGLARKPVKSRDSTMSIVGGNS